MKVTTVPKAGPAPLPELAAYLAPFLPLFYRPTQQTVERYLTGLLTDLPRKNCETIAGAVADTSPERLQHLLTDACWNPQQLDQWRVQRLVAQTPADGILVFDDTGLVKQGRASVGVARQYSGTLGKVGNCQIVVSAEYVVDDPATSTPLHWPVTARLYLPESWTSDPARCARAGVPPAVAAQTKPQIALALLDQARQWGVPFRVVVTDAGYGDNPDFLGGLEERQACYVCAVASDFGVRWPAAVAAAHGQRPPYAGRGQPPKERPAPLHTAAAVIATQPPGAWQTVQWRERGPNEPPLARQVLAVRVHRATGSERFSVTDRRVQTGPEGWLVAERPLPGESGEVTYYFSNLPPSTSTARLLAVAHLRWPVEQFYEDGKGECGWADYQGRSWEGLQRHLALVRLAYSFLVAQRLAVASSPAGELSPLRGVAEPARNAPPGRGGVVVRVSALVGRERPA
jgi:SRSO17 transposase